MLHSFKVTLLSSQIGLMRDRRHRYWSTRNSPGNLTELNSLGGIIFVAGIDDIRFTIIIEIL